MLAPLTVFTHHASPAVGPLLVGTWLFELGRFGWL